MAPIGHKYATLLHSILLLTYFPYFYALTSTPLLLRYQQHCPNLPASFILICLYAIFSIPRLFIFFAAIDFSFLFAFLGLSLVGITAGSNVAPFSFSFPLLGRVDADRVPWSLCYVDACLASLGNELLTIGVAWFLSFCPACFPLLCVLEDLCPYVCWIHQLDVGLNQKPFASS